MRPGRPYTVVLVDDSTPYRRGIARAIDAHDELVLVGECDGGEAGLAAIEALRPDVAVLDVRMPGVDGLTICRRLRDEPGTRTRAVVISAGMDDVVRGLALAAGAAATLSKTATRREICSAAVRVARAG
ncbi:response regulator [Conexibacter sp. W3-3-2]|uniref:response regulator transcription factor n=1 Tax=Conexibacter sp. W3-3-2 TaxID=2675227 RepID=UPI0012B92E9F|nr:response regulator transcription factor [Conexibacter sp. W3-3-2]MTD46495.1 response regulator [Conexibacter sp. W3-3-2]